MRMERANPPTGKGEGIVTLDGPGSDGNLGARHQGHETTDAGARIDAEVRLVEGTHRYDCHARHAQRCSRCGDVVDLDAGLGESANVKLHDPVGGAAREREPIPSREITT